MLIIGDTATLIITLAMGFTLLIKWGYLDNWLRAGLSLMTTANTSFFVFGDLYVSQVEIVFCIGIGALLVSIGANHGPQEKSQGSKEAHKAAQAKDTQRIDGYWPGVGQ